MKGGQILHKLVFGSRVYSLDLVELNNNDVFWSVSGSKKGSIHTGGGISIPDFKFLYGLCGIINNIALLRTSVISSDRKVCCFHHRNRVICGETKIFNNTIFYRVKAYSNYFRRNNEFFNYKDHELKPSGRGFFIQEFDFPVTVEGVEEAKAFSKMILQGIEQYLIEIISQKCSNIIDAANAMGASLIDLLHGEQIIIDGKPLWLTFDENQAIEILHRPLFEIICDRLREEPLNSSYLATSLNLRPETCEEQISPNSRYDYRFFQSGLLLDRLRRGYNSINYLVTQIPREALNESPTLSRLFYDNLNDSWRDWISATFSNDEYAQGRRLSYHVLKFEIDSIEGGVEHGIKPELSKLRSIAVRLFDLKRYFKQDRELHVEICSLVDRFLEIDEVVAFV